MSALRIWTATRLKFLAARVYNLALWVNHGAGRIAPGPDWPADPNWRG